MTRDKIFLQLISDDLYALHANALALEKHLRRLSLEIQSDNMDSLAGLIAQINCTSYAPIDAMLREAGLRSRESETGEELETTLSGVLAEAEANAQRANSRRLGAASAISIMRRSARYMELYCSSIADTAARFRLTELADHLRAWAREWIGLELNLNAVAARPREMLRAREEAAAFAA